MPTRTWPPAAALLLGLAAVPGCVDAGPATAYCGPADPVVAPQAVTSGGELHVEVTGLVDAGDCEPALPDGARYSIVVTSEARAGGGEAGPYSMPLGELDPSSDGGARGTVRVPEDFPLGLAEVSVELGGARTICEIDPTMQCAREPFTPIDVTG